jgi:hypothetical protein
VVIPTLAERHNQQRPYVYACDAPLTVRLTAGGGVAAVRYDGGHVTYLPVSSAEVVAGDCGQPATHVWKVRDRYDGKVRVIARCSAGWHTDTIQRHLRMPDRSYDLVEVLLPIEGRTP